MLGGVIGGEGVLADKSFINGIGDANDLLIRSYFIKSQLGQDAAKSMKYE